TRWWWVRHAPVTVNAGRIYGQIDHPADCSEHDKFRWLAHELPDTAQLYTSHLQRTLQTAAGIVTQGGGKNWEKGAEKPDFAEQNFGDWQGKTHDEISSWPDASGRNFWVSPALMRPPNGESFADVVARVAPTIHSVCTEFSGKNIVCAAHYGTIMAALAVALGGNMKHAMQFRIENLSITRIDCLEVSNNFGPARRQWCVHWVNRTAPDIVLPNAPDER
ncbi:MAG: histidine phosphatase family protein, partial [Pseudomonadota bacterium]